MSIEPRAKVQSRRTTNIPCGGREWVAMHQLQRVLLLAMLVWSGLPAWGADRTPAMASFYGSYQGKSISANEDGLTERDIDVVIKPTDKGFHLSWTTVVRVPKGGLTRKAYSIDFTQMKRSGVYASAMRTDMFGNRVPLDPLKGDPFVWAALGGDTLTVYSLHISEDGGYELQAYERALTADGLHLEFSRIREGMYLEYITGTLVRVAP